MRSIQNAISQLPGWGASSGRDPVLILPLTNNASGTFAAAVDVSFRRDDYGDGYREHYWNPASNGGFPAGGAQHIGGASFGCRGANVILNQTASQNDYLRAAAMTWSYWVKVHSFAAAMHPIARGTSPASFASRDINCYIQTDGYAVTRYFSGTSSRAVVANENPVPLGVWTHVVNVCQAGTSYVYVNGKLSGSGATAGNMNQTDRITCIGGLSANTGHTSWSTSDMDMAWLVVYGYALDAQAITKLYAATNPFT